MTKESPTLLRLCLTLLLVSVVSTLNIHIIPHTHDDVGWLKTVDEYYIGSNNSIQNAGVQYILDSVIPALLANPARRFIYVEIAFFERWWGEQSETMKQTVRQLVAAGRLEFINGGWCMNDEGATTYEGIIDQMTLGHQFLLREFGVRPTIGWHIDPFGHAATQASIFAQMGFNAFFFWRIDYQDRDAIIYCKRMEFVWRGSKSLGNQTQIFTSIFHNDYGPPPGFCFECGAPPVQNDPRIFNRNLKPRADELVRIANRWAERYRTENILIPFGSDFQYSNANVNFKNMDKLIGYIREHPDEYKNIEIFYSTPSDYLKAVHRYSLVHDLVWDVKRDDFFPYVLHPGAYWSGYFTSRPALKGYIRTRSNLLHTVEKLLVSARGLLSNSINTPENFAKIDTLERAFSVAQHHDAVAGTSREHVVDDYSHRLSIGTDAAESLIADLTTKLLQTQASQAGGAPLPSLSFCHHLNVSICDPLKVLAQGGVVPVVAVNPLAWQRTEYFRLPVPVRNVEVITSGGQSVSTQVYLNGDIPGIFTLAFAVTIPPLGYSSFVLQKASSKSVRKSYAPIARPEDDMVTIENEFLSAVFSTASGRLVSLFNMQENIMLPLTQQLLWYNASTGNTAESEGWGSSAYVLRPNSSHPFNLTSNNNAQLSFVNGSLVQEVRQVWTNWAYQTVRLYKGVPTLEVEQTIGPIPFADGMGKEVISRYSSSLETFGEWHTDSEGQEMQYRLRNYRPTWNVRITDFVGGNYYPVNTAAYIKDESADIQLTFLTDRSQGCASLEDGDLETLVHRRLLEGARFSGNKQAMNDSTTIRVVQKVILDRTENSSRLQRPHSLRLNNPATLLFGVGWQGNSADWFASFATTFSPLINALPLNVHLLTLRALPTNNEVLLRLNHIFAVGEDDELSAPAQVDIAQLFKNLRVESVAELTLTANQLKSEDQRLKWKTISEEDTLEVEQHRPLVGTVAILQPMEIRTFVYNSDAMLSALPDEILCSLFEYFSPKERISLALINKRFQSHAWDEMYWRTQCLHHATCKDYTQSGIIERKKPIEFPWRKWFFSINISSIGFFFRGRALYDYCPTEPTEVALKEGELLLVLEESDSGWWLCQNSKGEQGLAPSEYFETLGDEPVLALVRDPSRKGGCKPAEVAEQPNEELSREVVIIEEVLTARECEELITRAEAQGFGSNFNRAEILALRDPCLATILWQRVQHSLANQEDGWQAVSVNDEFRMLRYMIGHQSVAHTDGSCNRPEEGKRSLLSLVIYLNEGFRDGATEFVVPSSAIMQVRAKEGKAVIFPHAMTHRAMAVSYGTKYVLRTDILFQAAT